jgi:hypothetical protein
MNTTSLIDALEQDILSTVPHRHVNRIRKLLTLVDGLLAMRLSDRPRTIIGSRAQWFFLTPEVEAIEQSLIHIYRHLPAEYIEVVSGLLEIREVRVEQTLVPTRQGRTALSRQLLTPKGRILF